MSTCPSSSGRMRSRVPESPIEVSQHPWSSAPHTGGSPLDRLQHPGVSPIVANIPSRGYSTLRRRSVSSRHDALPVGQTIGLPSSVADKRWAATIFRVSAPAFTHYGPRIHSPSLDLCPRPPLQRRLLPIPPC